MTKYITGPSYPKDVPGNPGFWDQFGYVPAPSQETVDGIALAVERERTALVDDFVKSCKRKIQKRPLPAREPNIINLVRKIKGRKRIISVEKHGPSYFPVE